MTEIQMTSEFVVITHNINLATFFNKHDQHPYGAIAAKIFREMDFAKIHEFMVAIVSLCNEVGYPTNVVNALLHYGGYVKTVVTTEEWAEIVGYIQMTLGTELDKAPQEIIDILS